MSTTHQELLAADTIRPRSSPGAQMSTATGHEADILNRLDFAPRCEATTGCDALATHFIKLEATRPFRNSVSGLWVQNGAKFAGVFCRPHIDRVLSEPYFNTHLLLIRLEPLR